MRCTRKTLWVQRPQICYTHSALLMMQLMNVDINLLWKHCIAKICLKLTITVKHSNHVYVRTRVCKMSTSNRLDITVITECCQPVANQDCRCTHVLSSATKHLLEWEKTCLRSWWMPENLWRSPNSYSYLIPTLVFVEANLDCAYLSNNSK